MELLTLVYELRMDQKRAFLLEAKPSTVYRMTFAPRPIACVVQVFTHASLVPTNGYFSG